MEYKTYKKVFESIKKRSKKLYFSNLIVKYKNNIKKTWEVIRESIGKGKSNHQNFPKKIIVGAKNITNEELIAKNFNRYFSEIGPKLAKKIQTSPSNFESFMETCDTTLTEISLTINELKDAFFPLRQTKVLAMMTLFSMLLEIVLAL